MIKSCTEEGRYQWYQQDLNELRCLADFLPIHAIEPLIQSQGE